MLSCKRAENGARGRCAAIALQKVQLFALHSRLVADSAHTRQTGQFAAETFSENRLGEHDGGSKQCLLKTWVPEHERLAPVPSTLVLPSAAPALAITELPLPLPFPEEDV